jgi:PKD repeat protein
VYGSYLAALVFYSVLYGESVSSSSYNHSLTADDAAFLRHVSDSTVFLNPETWIRPLALPVARFSFITFSSSIEFINESEGATAYIWDFGDGSDPSFLENPEHSYTSSGYYSVTLHAFNSCRSDTFTQIVHVDVSSYVEESEPVHSSALIEAFPNPAKTGLSLTLNFSDKLQGSDIGVFDICGRFLYSFPSNDRSLSLNDLTKCLYFIRPSYNMNNAKAYKLVIE